jgi:hypothetical protein
MTKFEHINKRYLGKTFHLEMTHETFNRNISDIRFYPSPNHEWDFCVCIHTKGIGPFFLTAEMRQLLHELDTYFNVCGYFWP